MSGSARRTQFRGRTAWARSLEAPLRGFLNTEIGSASVLLVAAIAAVLWANIDLSSYESLWRTQLSVRVGSSGISQDLRGWVNTGLMTFFFFVVGLEVRREFDVGELRERRRLALPVIAALGGMVVPIAIFLAANAGQDSAQGWGVAMSTDTAFALGMLALVGPSFPDRLGGFLLTIIIVDDVVALLVIVAAYSGTVSALPLLIAAGVFILILALLAARLRYGPLYFLLAAVAWVALYESGIEPVVLGLAVGLITWAYPAGRGELERATDLFRRFREQPTPELARSARAGVRQAISPNARLLELYHPWTSYVIVPLFALANIGIAIDGGFLSKAFSSPVTLGILIAYVVGKPVGITGASALVTRVSGGRLRPPVGWVATAGGGAIAGIGFTVSLLIATLAFHGVELREAKLGVLSAALCASALTWLVFRATALLPLNARIRVLLGGSEALVDLAVPVEPSEAAAAQGAFWEMHDLLLEHQGELGRGHIHEYAAQLGLDLERYREELQRNEHLPRVEEDVDSADLSGVTGTPTFFVNERRHEGAYDIDSLSAAVRSARARQALCA